MQAQSQSRRLQTYLEKLSSQARGRLLAEVERLKMCGDDMPGLDVVLTELRSEFRKNGSNVRINDPNHTLSCGAGTSTIDANTCEVPLSSISGNIQVNTLAGNDTLTLNLANGNFIPAGGVSYAGGDPTTGIAAVTNSTANFRLSTDALASTQ